MSDEQKPLVQNASSRKQTRAAGKREKRNTERELEELRVILSTRQGRKWWWRKMGDFRVFHQTFHKDPYQTAFNEGIRSAGLDLLFDVNSLAPEIYMLMVKEDREDAERGMA